MLFLTSQRTVKERTDQMKKRLSTFIGGMLAGAMIFACGTAAFAAGTGNLRFSDVNMAINGDTVIKAGETLTTAAGGQVPSTITYTDELGRDTTYLPIRTFSKLLDIPVTWKDGTVHLGYLPTSIDDITIDFGTSEDYKPEGIWVEQPLHSAGSKAGAFTEVEPVWPANDKITGYYAKDLYMSASFGVGNEYNPFNKEGGYCSIKITNNGANPVALSIKCVSTITSNAFPDTIVPAGQTVIRTFRAEPYTGGLHQPGLSFLLHNNIRGDYYYDDIKATVSVVSFDPNRTGAPLFS